ncbi:BTAD domain-containing putative transcriptional regulator [Streptomyces sp. NPDC046821]|uniref:AfsR/SARP family transcriptional regulator n=1 Tax=Streptomyces sp. NPDC046821 TaxID=3154702 RepID=UPI0033E77E54
MGTGIGFAVLGDVVIRSPESDVEPGSPGHSHGNGHEVVPGSPGRRSEIVPGSPRQRAVLALLLVDVNRPLSLDTLVERIWGASPPRQASATLYSYISRLRALRVTPAEQEAWDIVRTPAGYVLRTDERHLDLVRFRTLVGQARTGPPEEARGRYEDALAVWRGRPFAGLRSEWLDGYRLTLEAEHLGVRLEFNELLLAEGRHADLVQPLAALSAAHPLDERIAHQHILALYRSGQPAAALAAYEQLRSLLADELGTDPGTRLQELHQRMLVSDDELLAVTVTPGRAVQDTEPSPRVPRQLPASPTGFIGRDDALKLLDEQAVSHADENTPTVSVIGGMGGIGKTWLALRWAHEHGDEFPDGQLYAQLNGFSPGAEPARPHDVLHAFLVALGAVEHEMPADTEGRAALYRTLVARRRILVLLDNARDSAQVLPLLPGSPGCLTLVTSRNRLSGLKVRSGAGSVDLGVLPDMESSRLFARRMGTARAAAEPAMRDIVRSCAGLPLALDIAAAHAVGLPVDALDDLAQELRDPSTRLDALDAGDVSTNLRVLFSASHHALDPESAHVFRLMGLSPLQDIALPALAHLVERTPAQTRRALRVLQEACLVRQHLPGRYHMHDLVRLYAEEQAAGLPAEVRDQLTRRLVDFYVETAHAAHRVLDPHRSTEDPLPTRSPESAPRTFDDADSALAWFEAEYTALEEIAETAQRHRLDAAVCGLTWSLHTFRWRRGLFAESIRAWQSALDAACALEDASLAAHTRQRLAVALAQAGRYEEALPHLAEARSCFAESGDTTGLTRTHHALAEVHVRLAAYESALPHFAEALDGYRRLGNQVGESNILNGTGWALARLGRFAEGEEHCLQALPLLQHHRDGEGLASTWDTLAYIARHTGCTDRALHAYGEALTHYQAIGNANREADTWSALGDIYTERGEADRAREAWTAALDLYRTQRRDAAAERMGANLASGRAQG